MGAVRCYDSAAGDAEMSLAAGTEVGRRRTRSRFQLRPPINQGEPGGSERSALTSVGALPATAAVTRAQRAIRRTTSEMCRS